MFDQFEVEVYFVRKTSSEQYTFCGDLIVFVGGVESAVTGHGDSGLSEFLKKRSRLEAGRKSHFQAELRNNLLKRE